MELHSYDPDTYTPGSRCHIVFLGESLFLKDYRFLETELTQGTSKILNWIRNFCGSQNGSVTTYLPLASFIVVWTN